MTTTSFGAMVFSVSSVFGSNAFSARLPDPSRVIFSAKGPSVACEKMMDPFVRIAPHVLPSLWPTVLPSVGRLALLGH